MAFGITGEGPLKLHSIFMTLTDLIISIITVSAMMVPSILAAKRGSRNTGNFILGGRRLPWWLGGAAMVAGGTNADSALHQSGKIQREGLSGAWFYWSQILGNVWHSLVFSRLWRRLGINTVVEFYSVRYSGRSAAMGRIWSMVFGALIESTVGLALGLLAMIKITSVLFPLTPDFHVAGHYVPTSLCIAAASVILGIGYSTLAGLLGVVAGDMVEFVVALSCSYLLMFFAWHDVGYSFGLRTGLMHLGLQNFTSLAPHLGFSAFILFVIQPIATLSGNNSLNQRFLAMRDERQAMFSGIWRLISAYFFRAWPWYLCGLASLVLLATQPHASELSYPLLILRCLPNGLRGLVFASLVVTFMGAVGTLMHNFGSIFVNDFYRLYIVRHGSEQHYVWTIRLAMLVTAGLATAIALASDQILSLLQMLITISAASGLVMLLRWHWWRVNGWADFAGQACALPVTLFYEFGWGHTLVRWIARLLGSSLADDIYGITFLLTVTTVTVCWLLVLILTPQEPNETLVDFYRRARPYGWWGPIVRLCPECTTEDSFRRDLFRYLLAMVLSLALLFGMGLLLLGHPVYGLGLVAAGTGAGFQLVRDINEETEARNAVTPQAVTSNAV